MSSFANFIAKLMRIERRRDGRVAARSVEAFYEASTEEKPVQIKDISATGIYLITAERWPPESTVSVILRQKRLFGIGESSQVRIKARVARWGDDGVGLTFVPSHMAPSDWLTLMERASSTSSQHGIISRFRNAHAMAILAGICPEDFQQILLMFEDGLYDESAQRVISITLQAASLLPEFAGLDQIHVAPGLLLRIVKEVSQSGAENLIPFWSRLLASSCLTADHPNTNLLYIDTFSQLNPVQVRIFTAGCNAAVMRGPAGIGDAPPAQIFYTQNEVRQLAGTRNLGHIERDLQHLHSLGLLEQTTKASLFSDIEQANLTPTPFGMQLYSRCCGRFPLSSNHGCQPSARSGPESAQVNPPFNSVMFHDSGEETHRDRRE